MNNGFGCFACDKCKSPLEVVGKLYGGLCINCLRDEHKKLQTENEKLCKNIEILSKAECPLCECKFSQAILSVKEK